MFEPDREVLQDVCIDIATDNHGLLYVNDDKNEIKSRYASQSNDEGLMGTVKNTLGGNSLSLEELQQKLEEIANDDYNDFERLRTGVYFVDPLKSRHDEKVVETLENLFQLDIVVPERELKSKFNLAKEDVDFFTGRLEDENYIKRISTSDHGNYFTIGKELKGRSGDKGVDTRLKKRAKNGLIAHGDLESVIDVAATSDVIRYLEHEEFIIELDEKYIVRNAMEAYADYIAQEVSERVADAFESSAYVLPTPEYEQVVENEVNAEFEVLDHLNATDRGEVLEEIGEAMKKELGLDEKRKVVVQQEEFDEYVTRRAEELLTDVDDGTLGTEEGFRDAGFARIEERNISDSSIANEFIHRELKQAFEDEVDALFTIDKESDT